MSKYLIMFSIVKILAYIIPTIIMAFLDNKFTQNTQSYLIRIFLGFRYGIIYKSLGINK